MRTSSHLGEPYEETTVSNEDRTCPEGVKQWDDRGGLPITHWCVRGKANMLVDLGQ